ncbi:hypothetical protein AC249_AIPGENE18762, partial [Exaiptasia diaphana]
MMVCEVKAHKWITDHESISRLTFTGNRSTMKLTVLLVAMSFYSVKAAEWEPLGCYADTRDRAMPHYFKTVVSDDYKHI